ncbi:MAG: kynureninase [Candidatus Promineofilum sp.]|nr:kynureninase [Promineifilum sp.]MCW5863590.1 kynureninase [Anaerolineae bacterium]
MKGRDAALSLRRAQAMDAADPLTAFRDRFVIDDTELIYLDGNSLGRLPRATAPRLAAAVADEWGGRLVRGWNEGWFDAPDRIGGKLAGLLGAAADEVILADATSVNLFKLTLAALLARPGRHTIVTDDLNFPSDLYILRSAAALAGRPVVVRVVPSADGIHGPAEALAAAMDEDTALLSLSHTVFKSGYTYDMAALTALAHRAGALALWDLSHSAGAVVVDLRGADADLAVGCTYKYLNGGPGAPAFLYVRRDLHDALANPISGWLGRADPFDFALDYAPAAGIRRFLSGTPPILSLTAVEPGIDLLLEAGMARLRERSVRLSEYLIARWEERLEPLGFRLNSPRDPARRGSHVSLGHDDGLRINLALIHEARVLPDFRRPDNIRLGIAPLYNTFTELHTAVERLRAVVVEGLHRRYDAAGLAVT